MVKSQVSHWLTRLLPPAMPRSVPRQQKSVEATASRWPPAPGSETEKRFWAPSSRGLLSLLSFFYGSWDLCLKTYIYILIYIYIMRGKKGLLPGEVRFDCAGPVFYKIRDVFHLPWRKTRIAIIIIIIIVIVIIIKKPWMKPWMKP